MAAFFNVIPADIGRPLAHITNSFDDPRLAALFDSLPVGGGGFDASGDITRFNQPRRRFLPTRRMPSHDPERLARWRAWDTDGRPLGPGDFPRAAPLAGADGRIGKWVGLNVEADERTPPAPA